MRRYYYSYLDVEEKRVYDAIARAIDGGYDQAIVDAPISIDRMIVVFTYAFNDNPQWLSTDPRLSFSTRGSQFTFNLGKVYTDDECKKAVEYFDGIIKSVREKCKGLEDYKKALYIAKIFIEKCTYGFPEGDNGSSKSQLATSVALSNKTVCAGLSRAFKYVCDGLGIDCIVVNGDTIRNIVPRSEKDKEEPTQEGTVDVYKALRATYTSLNDRVSSNNKVNYVAHAWNMAKIDGKWLVIDLNATQNANKDGVFKRLYNFCVPENILTGYIWNKNVTPK